MTNSVRVSILTTAILMSVAAPGCGGGRRFGGPVLEPLPQQEAVRLVNENVAQASGTMRATGSVDGFITNMETRKRFSYNVDGTLFYLAPYYVRFDLKKLGDRQVLFGSNNEYYWAYVKEDNEYYCGRTDGGGISRVDLPLRPSQIIEAVGLMPIPAGGEQHIESQYQRIVFPGPGGVASREYWLDRRAPRLLRRVVFRNADGSVAMDSQLSDYRPVNGGPMMPHMISAQWPTRGARMRFDVGRWTTVSDVVPGGPQFTTPPECLSQRSASRDR